MKKVIYSLIFSLFLIVGIVNVKAKEKELIHYNISCSDMKELYISDKGILTELEGEKITFGFSIYQDGSDYYLRVDSAKNMNNEQQSWLDKNTSKDHGRVDTDKFNPSICGYFNNSFGIVNFDGIFEKIEEIGKNKTNLVLISTKDSKDPLYLDFEDNLEKYENEGSVFKSKVLTSEEPSEEDKNAFNCIYKCDTGSNIYEDVTIKYSNNDFSLETEYKSSFKKDFLTSSLASKIKIPECPDKVIKCNNNLHGEQFFALSKNECDEQDNNLNIKCTLSDNKGNRKQGVIYDDDKDYSMNLDGCIIDKDTQDIINWVLGMIRLVGIILLIVLGMLDFIKAAASGEQEEMKKSKGKFVKRLIACVVLFFIPIIVNILLGLVNMASGENCFGTTKTEETSNTN